MPDVIVICAAFGIGVLIGAFIPLARRTPPPKAVLDWKDEADYSQVETAVGHFSIGQDRCGWWEIWGRHARPPEWLKSADSREKAKQRVQEYVDSRMREMEGRKS